jgi:hypothetical protein
VADYMQLCSLLLLLLLLLRLCHFTTPAGGC